MNKQDRESFSRFCTAAYALGLNWAEIESLVRDARRLHRWAEEECNGTIQRDEETGECFRYWGQDGPGEIHKAKTRDLETPARKRIEAIAQAHRLRAMIQGDPRGWPVQLCKPEDVKNDFEYRGLAVPV